MLLLNPKQYDCECPDGQSKDVMQKLIDFFENKGKAALTKDDRENVWYSDIVEFQKAQKLFSQFLTPPQYAGGDKNSRWDTWRNCDINEITGFFGLCYWYVWQVTILGLGPIWMSDNEEAKSKAARLLKEGAVFAFGLSERQHGADVYSTEMLLTPTGEGRYKANGSKYYIGNGNVAEMVSTFGKIEGTGEYVFFVANFSNPAYECVKNTVASQNFVAEFKLTDYEITESDILSRGQPAWDSALNTINVGKYNLGWASIGICTHALYEAINHASARRLYNMYVTDFPHVKQAFVDAYSRLVAMKLFTLRAADYMRVASPDDRRYLLYNPVVKMKVTTQGEDVMNLLWDVIAAKGFEKDTFFQMAARDIRALPKLEGTVHVNIALIVKFMKNYFFFPAEYDDVGRQDEPCHDEFLFNQGPSRGLGKIQFHDYHPAFNAYDLPNVNLFVEQIDIFKLLLATATPDEKQRKDIDFLLSLGEIFTLIVYGQLVLENARIYKVEEELIDQIFDFMIRDFSKFALQVYSKPSSTERQMELCSKMIRKAIVNNDRYGKIWKEHVYALKDVYTMND